MDSFSLNAEVHCQNNFSWWLTVVYGPQCSADKVQFLLELSERRQLCHGPWLLIGDFNMILRASEKNNDNLDRATMARFREFVGNHELKELYMHGRLFTWSNERESPTLTKIDRALASVDWDMAYPDSFLQALSSSLSDHAALHLSLSAGFRPKHRFRFELFWVKLPGFQETVMEAWVCDPRIVDPFKRLNELLRNTAVALQAWSQRTVGNVKLKIAIANLLVLRFDAAQDRRVLTQQERWLRNTLKLVVLGLSSLERTIARQRSRVRWLAEGDANSKYFHTIANGRRSKNFISAVRVGEQIVTEQEDKQEAFFQTYASLLGSVRCREFSVDLQSLGFQEHDLSELESMFTEAEVWKVIQELPPDRAPGPDGFLGVFYQKAWGIIKQDVMAAIYKLGVGDGRGFAKLNNSLVTLIPKRPDAMDTGDFRPISLVHSFGKLFSKLLAVRLRRKLGELVSANQSAFIKGRQLHDNFMLVRQVARKINARKEKGVFLKLDISRAFDSLSWSFLGEVLRALGFGELWLKWVMILLSTASLKLLVNGVPGRKIVMVRGLRQGDPTSPQFFVLAMEVLSKLVFRAAEVGLLEQLAGCSPLQRISVFADDVALFVRPWVHDVTVIREILQVFGMASGLLVNYAKSAAVLIRGDPLDTMAVKHILQCKIDDFPCKYLGLQLSIRQLTKVQWQPFLDQVISSLPAWQKGFLQRSGRLILIKHVVMSRTVHHLLVDEAPAWLIEEVNKWARAFFWAGKDKVNGGQCLVAWQNICKPVCFGGLGVKDLHLQGLALRVRWEWLSRVDGSRPWQGLPMKKDSDASAVFHSLVKIKVGNGANTLFWKDRWIGGMAVEDVAPLVCAKVHARSANSRTVMEALQGHRWIGDIRGELSHDELLQCLQIWAMVCSLVRDVLAEDEFSWPWSSTGMYTASSTYRVLCQGSIQMAGASYLWRSWAPLKCRIFLWLALQFRVWTSDRRCKHGLQDAPSPCFTCLQEEDTVSHVLLGCVYARQVWFACFQKLGLGMPIPEITDTLQSWWLSVRLQVTRKDRRRFDTFMILVCWRLWKQRNARVFQQVAKQYSVEGLVEQIFEEWELWKLTGLGGRSSYARVVH